MTRFGAGFRWVRENSLQEDTARIVVDYGVDGSRSARGDGERNDWNASSKTKIAIVTGQNSERFGGLRKHYSRKAE